MSSIEHFSPPEAVQYVTVKAKELTLKQILFVPCTTCGAATKEVCELHSGAPRTEPHRDRKLSAAEAVVATARGTKVTGKARHACNSRRYSRQSEQRPRAHKMLDDQY